MWHRGPSGAPMPKIYYRCAAVGGAGPSGAFPPHPPFAPYPLGRVVSGGQPTSVGEQGGFATCCSP